ncbi:MAG: hypothetical protein AVDCRST_MAG77-238 [uncultured Chloroflexi bacterium]|uniref:Uncharacterized protein n=1 Tax=uncultured Chloroflexota bacterium TaxID=166587 RepID=A0A6J4H9Z9_9CHLR|nr:MAG: hypothetical protein AVDCRST_MAG77-238 [uncultured Chloroflexota bacterium]
MKLEEADGHPRAVRARGPAFERRGEIALARAALDQLHAVDGAVARSESLGVVLPVTAG